jgi:PAS domain S-box-containing protein
VNFEVLRAGAPAWAGPVFWAFIGWTYVCIAGGLVLYLGTARRMVANAERRRAVLLAAASAMPVLMSLVYLFRLLPMEFDLTPTGLVFALAVLSITIFRYQLLESLPLARRDVIERLDDGVIMANSAGVILDLNPAAAAILRSSAESLRGQWLAEALRRFVRKEDAAPVAAAIEALSRSGETWVSELRTPDERWIEIRGACGSSADGEPSGLFALLRDRTEERRGERFVRQTQKLETVGTLVSGIAHEINNPLAFIRANLSEIHRMGEQVERYLDDPDAKLARELKDLAQIAHETLDGIGRIERIVAGMRRLSPSRRDAVGPVELNEVVEDAVRLANLRRDAGVELSTTLAPRLPLIEGSPQRLVQALLNLLVNARQALQGQPAARIAVETCCEGANVVVRVCDNGPGIPEAIQERIFDPFFTTKDPDQGTGLGLSIAFDILRDHGGVLEVGCSGAAGTEFAARIPARRP